MILPVEATSQVNKMPKRCALAPNYYILLLKRNSSGVGNVACHLRVIHRHKAVGSIWGENMRTFLGIPGAFRARHPRDEGQEGGESRTIPRESTWVCSKRGRGRGRVRRQPGAAGIFWEQEETLRPLLGLSERLRVRYAGRRRRERRRRDRGGCKHKC